MVRSRASIKVRAVVLVSAFLLVPLHSPIAKPYKGAELRTRASYLYGRFEVRCKTFFRSGALASFFTYNDDYPATPWNEIDIEILGRYENDVQFNAITPGTVNHVAHRFVPFRTADDFQSYGFEWTPDYVAWFVNGVEVARQTAPHVQELSHPQKIMMNIWCPDAPNWAGAFDPQSLPIFASYDRVSYASYTPGAGDTGTGNNFTFQWTDEFDSYDSTRWQKASHTWPGNNSDFVPENVVFRDGHMILCLTDESLTGYRDQTPPTMQWARMTDSSVTVRFSEELDRPSAETPSNFLIAGGPAIVSSALLPDLRTVQLSTPGIDTSKPYNVVVLNGVVFDRASPPNAATIQSKAVIRPKPLAFPVKMNIGGSSVYDFRPDQEWSELVEYGFMDGTAASIPSSAPIAGTTEPEVFRSERFNIVSYRLRVPRGVYNVSLLFCENYFNSSGLRVFNVRCEGAEVLTDFDIHAEVGKNAALVKSIPGVACTDGELEIHFESVIENPSISGIIVESVATSAPEEGQGTLVPEEMQLYPNYPNPFNGGTMVTFSLSRQERLMLQVFDTLGRVVERRDLGTFGKGRSSVWWSPGATLKSLSSGVYYYSLVGSTASQMQRLVYLK